MNRRSLSEFESATGIIFHNKELLQEAFLHSSYANEAPPGADLPADNERLEFLGDAVLEFVVSKYLYEQYSDLREGELTRLRAALVRRETLAGVAQSRGLGDFLILGRGEEESGGRNRAATLCATYEAVIGAVFLDQGLDAVEAFAIADLRGELEVLEPLALGKDAKSRLQEYTQQEFGVAPRYRVADSTGPDHAKIFVIEVTVLGHRAGVGRGGSKQEASQEAAIRALITLGLSDAVDTPTEPDLGARWPIAEELLQRLQKIATAVDS
jgi:ribonuclease III